MGILHTDVHRGHSEGVFQDSSSSDVNIWIEIERKGWKIWKYLNDNKESLILKRHFVPV